ncbi:MAG: nucleotide exchange factor GrpE [Lentisphaeria bacterium]
MYNNEYPSSLHSRMEALQHGIIEVEHENRVIKENYIKVKQQNELLRNKILEFDKLEQEFSALQQELIRKNNILTGMEERCKELEKNKDNIAIIEAQQQQLEKNSLQIEGLIKQLEDAKTKSISIEKHQELQQDYALLRQRQKEELVRSQNESIAKTVKPLLEYFDTVQIIQSAINDNFALSSIDQALKIMNREFERTLKQLAIKPINALGELFNPELHEAVQTENHEEKADDEVLKQWRCGYLLEGKLIRPATVVVNKK